MSDRPIADYALLSDCNGSALISNDGSLDWLCLPRFDSCSVFARLLDDAAGHWSIRPAGTVAMTDAMALGANAGGHELGTGAPCAVLRRLSCLSGELELILEFAPRPEYGRVTPLVMAASEGAVTRGSPDMYALSSPVPLHIDHDTVYARFRLRAGEQAAFALQYTRPGEPPRWWTQRDIERGVEDTISGWRSWSDMHQSYEGPWRELVHHSGRVLQALTYAPTGAIVAAPTTSLPETIGGERNWDYRYSWVRDASFTLRALWVAACPDEATAFFSFSSGRRRAGSGGRPVADHVWDQRRARPDRTSAGAPCRVAGQSAGSRGQRCLAAGAVGRLRRAPRCRPPAAATAGRSR